ncbi:MAG: hypothetical protein GY851_33260 [bacterium]|nr:hypothetical protein [bacterium]
MPDDPGRAGSASTCITEALYRAHPAFRERDLVDDLRVTALYADHGGTAVCLLTYDVCEIRRKEVPPLKQAVAEALEIPTDHVHCYCTHTHSSSMDDMEHDMAFLAQASADAALAARDDAVAVGEVEFLRVDTGLAFNINRRTVAGDLGAWCLMQTRGCIDDGQSVDGTGLAHMRLESYGADEDELLEVVGPFPATRPNDPWLDVILFPGVDGGYAGGLVRFNAHAVICSAGYWRPNLGRDYPGALCDRLSAHFGCGIQFLQGPCGDHRPRHREVGARERDRIANGLAECIIGGMGEARRVPFNRLRNAAGVVPVPVCETFPHSLEAARHEAAEAQTALDSLPHGRERLAERKRIAERRAFYNQSASVWEGASYLTEDECEARRAHFSISHVAFGDVNVANFPGELFSTIVDGLDGGPEGLTVVCSFADGVTGYLMPENEVTEGGYESTWALFDPAAISGLRREMETLMTGELG